jgi:hypothetical protein
MGLLELALSLFYYSFASSLLRGLLPCSDVLYQVFLLVLFVTEYFASPFTPSLISPFVPLSGFGGPGRMSVVFWGRLVGSCGIITFA